MTPQAYRPIYLRQFLADNVSLTGLCMNGFSLTHVEIFCLVLRRMMDLTVNNCHKLFNVRTKISETVRVSYALSEPADATTSLRLFSRTKKMALSDNVKEYFQILDFVVFFGE